MRSLSTLTSRRALFSISSLLIIALLSLQAAEAEPLSVQSSYVSIQSGTTIANFDGGAGITSADTQAFFSATFDKEIFFDVSSFCLGGGTCNKQGVGSCSEFQPIFPATCIDFNSSVSAKPIGPGELHHYSFFVDNICNHIVVNLQVQSGDADLYVGDAFLPDPPASGPLLSPPVYAFSDLILGDTVVLCAGGPSEPNTQPPYFVIAQLEGPRIFYITVQGTIAGTYSLSLAQGSVSQPQMLLPVNEYYNLAAAVVDITCEDDQQFVSDVPTAENGISGSVPVVQEAAFAYFGSVAGVPQQFLPVLDKQTFVFRKLLMQQYRGYTVPISTVNCSSCSANFSQWLNGSGVPFDSVVIERFPDVIEKCTPSVLLSVLQNLTDLTVPVWDATSIGQLIGIGNAVTTLNAWDACLKLIDELLMFTPPSEVANSTSCLVSWEDPSWRTDPCCNPIIQLYQCCAPRTTWVTTFVEPDSTQLGTCHSPSCSGYAAQQLSTLYNVASDTVLSCDALALASMALLNSSQFNSCIADLGWATMFRNNIPCYIDSDCPSPMVCNGPRGYVCTHPYGSYQPLIECVSQYLVKSNDGFFAAYVISDTPNVDPTNLTQVVNFIATSPTFQSVGCTQWLSYMTPLLPSGLDPSTFDTNQTQCLAAGAYCNSDGLSLEITTFPRQVGGLPFLATPTTKTKEQCENIPWKLSGYCYDPTQCDAEIPTACPEVPGAVYKGCFGGSDTTQAGCEYGGGIWWQSDAAPICYYPNGTDLASCIPVEICGFGSVECDVSCTIFSLSEAECDCSLYVNNASSPLSPLCVTIAAMSWQQSTGTCIVSGAALHICLAVPAAYNATYFWGASWSGQPAFTDPASCAGGGSCSDMVSTTQAECEVSISCSLPFWSSQHQKTTAKECTDAGYCNDLLQWDLQYFCNPPTGPGVCCLIPPVQGADGYGLCAVGTLTNMGCVQGNVDPQDCAAAGGTEVLAAVNETDCESRTRCLETSSGSPFYTWKSPANCSACGGQSIQLYNWTYGVASPGVWTSYQWRQRQLLSWNTYGQRWDLVAAEAAVSGAYYSRFAAIAQSYLSCSVSSQANLVSQLLCDCTERADGCFRPSPTPLGSTVLCNGVSSVFHAPPAVLGIAPLLGTVEDIGGGCTNVQLSQLSVSIYRRTTIDLFSSPFLASALLPPYATITNVEDTVVVAQFLGDGIAIKLTPQLNLERVQLCLELNPLLGHNNRFPIYDIGYATTYTTAPSVGAINVMQANVTLMTLSEKNITALCSPIGFPLVSGMYFPVARVPNPESATFYKTLSANEHRAFVAATVLYTLMLILCLYRLISLLLWSLWKHPDNQLSSTLRIPKFAAFFLSLFFLLRCTYFVLAPLGTLQTAPQGVRIFLAEMPTFLFFTTCTLMIAWWIQLWHGSDCAVPGFLGKARPVFLVVNLALYSLFIITVVIYTVSAQQAHQTGCTDHQSRSVQAAHVLAKIYKYFIVIVACLLAFGYLLYGIRLFFALGNLSGDAASIAYKFAGITLSASFGLIGQSVLLLYVTIDGAQKLSNVLAIALELPVEILPSLALMLFMRQPRIEGLNFVQDIFWCLWADEADATGFRAGNGEAKPLRPSTESTE